MWEAAAGNGLDLILMGSPIVDGQRLNVRSISITFFPLLSSYSVFQSCKASRIYIAPLFDEEVETNDFICLSNVMGSCSNCHQSMDLSILALHKETWLVVFVIFLISNLNIN